MINIRGTHVILTKKEFDDIPRKRKSITREDVVQFLLAEEWTIQKKLTLIRQVKKEYKNNNGVLEVDTFLKFREIFPKLAADYVKERNSLY